MENEMTYSILDITADWANTCDHTSSFYKGRWKFVPAKKNTWWVDNNLLSAADFWMLKDQLRNGRWQ